jgi:predicted lipid-binding transport protein (Tim44 family)
MSKWIAVMAMGLFAATASLDAEAQRRLGGGMSFGKPSPTLQQRQATPPAKPQQSPQQAAPSAQPAAAGAPAAAARTASPWRGALMGLAAGLGLAALASWLGLGEAFAMFLMVALLALVAMAVFGMLMRRARPPQPAYPGAAPPSPATWHGTGGPSFNPMPREQAGASARAAMPAPVVGRPGSAMDELMRGGSRLDEPWGIPADFDRDAFLTHARTYFGRLQDAWAKNDLDQLAEFSTQEMFTALTHELRARGPVGSVEVVALDAKLLGMEHDASEHLASVRFTGTMRVDGELESFDEVWNLAKPVDGRTGWLLAGIQQLN